MRLGKRDWQALSVWLLTIVLLSGSFAIYSYFFVEHRELYFTEKKLRELRLLADRLKLRLENIANNVLPNAVNGADGQDTCEENVGDRSLKVFEIDGAPAAPRPATTEEACRFRAVSYKTDLVPNFTLDKIIEKRRLGGTNARTVSDDSPLAIRTEGETTAFLFSYQSTKPAPDGLAPKWRGHIELPNLLGQNDIDSFDQLLVTNKRGEVQFQFGSTRISSASLASLVEGQGHAAKPAKSGEDKDAPGAPIWSSVSDSASVVPVTLAGEDYLLFLEPVRLSLGGDPADQVTPAKILDWRMVGIVARERFRRDSSTFSYTIVVIFLFVLLLLVFAEPLIKVLSLGSTDPLRKRDVVSLTVSFTLIIALGSLFAVDLFEYASLQDQIDLRLGNLADDINSGFNKDLTALLNLLTNTSEKEVPLSHDGTVVDLLNKQRSEGVKGDNECPHAPEEPKKAEEHHYPLPDDMKRAFEDGALFQRIVWIDPCGNQRRKWTIDANATPLISVRERPYFKRAKAGQLWKKKLNGKDEVCFWLGPIESWNTGERLATISVRGPANVKEDSNIDAGCEFHVDQSEHWVISADVTLPSLRDVALPPGYGFVVVDRSGNVLFHSDSARHLRENFFEESDEEPALRAAVFGGGTEFIDARYLGTDHRFRSNAIDGPPWTLFVFYDKHSLRIANVEILSTALVLFLIFLALQIPALVLLWFRDTAWLWPKTSPIDAYPPYLLGVLGQLVVLSAAILFFSPVSSAYAAFLLPSAAFVSTYFHFGFKKSTITISDGVLSLGPLLVAGLALLVCCWLERKLFEFAFVSLAAALSVYCIFSTGLRERFKRVKKLPSPRTSYLLKIVSLLLLMGFLPAVAAFRIAYENEVVLLLKYGQHRLEQSLESRKHRLEEQAIKISGSGGENFFKARMKDTNSRDVYQHFFFRCSTEDPQIATTPSRSPLGEAVKKVRQHMLFDPVAVEGQGLLHGVPEDHFPSWLAGHPSCLLLTATAADVANPNPALFRSRAVEVPDWRKPASYAWLGGVILFLFCLAKGVIAAAGFLAKHVFLIDFVDPAATPPAVSAFAGSWLSLKPEERIALFDVSEDGFVNAKNKSIPKLLERGLLKLSPLSLRLEGYREVISAEDAVDKSIVPESQAAWSLWRMMKWPLLVALLGMAVFLFFNQRSVFEGGVGFIGAMAAAVTAFFNLFDQLRGGKR